MSYAYIRRVYAVDPKVGQIIVMDGRIGTITRPQGDPQYLRVRFFGEKHISNVHPTWRVDYHPSRIGEADGDGSEQTSDSQNGW